MASINPIQLEKFLKGLNYPVSKAELIKYAEQHGADENARAVLQKLPEKTYEGPTGVSVAVSQIDDADK
jgi:hypothetical protein